MTPRLDVIIPLAHLVKTSLRSRIENINMALRYFYVKQTGLSMNMIFVEQSLDGNLYYLENIEVPRGIVHHNVELHYPKFNKPWCLNAGFKAGVADYVMMADSDIISFSDYFADAVRCLEEKKLDWCFAWNELYYADYLEKRAVTVYERQSITQHHNEIFAPSRGVNEGGFVLFKREFYERIGMGNEFVEELGGPDNELAHRAYHVSKTYEKYPAFIYHLEHEQTPKSDRPSRRENIMLYRAMAKNPDKVISTIRRLGGGADKPYCAGKNFYKETGLPKVEL